MGRTLRILILAALAVSTAACGGSSASSNVASLQSGDVAVVGDTHITRKDLDHQIKLEVRAMQVGSKKPIPKVGTSAYTTTIVQPVVAYLVTQAQVQNIAKALHVSVTKKQLQTQVKQAIAQHYGGNQAKYQADLKKFDLTEADVEREFSLSLLEQNIETKLMSQVKVTPKELHDYYNSHQSLYAPSSKRTVDYVLVPSKALADKAHAALAGGKSFKAVAKGAIDDSSLHEPFVATEGQIDAAFQQAAFSLKTNQLSGLVPVDRAYVDSQPSLKGKCKPTCYFVIRPTADVVKGVKKSFASVEAQIRSTLLSSRQSTHLQTVVTKLENAQKKITRYAAGYKPPKTPSTPTGVQTAPTT